MVTTSYTRRLDYYATVGTDASARKKSYNGTADPWWLRSIDAYYDANGNTYYREVNTSGNLAMYTTSSRGVSPAFRIG